MNEVCDGARFEKKVHRPVESLRDLGGDGLFTAYNDEPKWPKAHRLLMPAFGPIGVRAIFDCMDNIAEQMLQRWERFGPGAVVDAADNVTQLTLDTIALCAFDYRFNSFYQTEMHPFVAPMVGALAEALCLLGASPCPFDAGSLHHLPYAHHGALPPSPPQGWPKTKSDRSKPDRSAEDPENT